MKTLTDHIKEVKKRPHHVRKQIAFTAAGGLTAFVAVVWLTGSLMTGAFALKSTNFAESTGGTTVTVSSGSAVSGVAGAAAALPASAGAPARIEIVDVASSTKVKAEPTTIPF